MDSNCERLQEKDCSCLLLVIQPYGGAGDRDETGGVGGSKGDDVGSLRLAAAAVIVGIVLGWCFCSC